MACSYAGVPLLLETDQHAEYVARYWDVAKTLLTSNAGYRDDIDVLPFPPEPVEEPPGVGVLRWPTGASRCATFFAVVDEDRLDLIRAAVGDPAAYADLVLSDGNTGNTVTASMRMVPPLCVHDCGGDDGGKNLWLLRLVDRRFWWRWTSGNVTVGEGTSWSSLIGQIASAMSASVDVGDVELGYDEPSDRWATFRKPLPSLLDAACHSVGHRVVCNLDGTAFTTDWADAVDAAAVQFADDDFRVTVGGEVAVADIRRAVPAGVRVCFGQIIGGVAQPDPYTLPIALADLSHPGYASSTGVVGATATINADLIYDGANAAACAAYAEQAAYDFYGWKLCRWDFTAPGVVAWEPTGAEDAVEWHYRDGGRLLTRVVLGPFQEQRLGGWEVETAWRFPLVRILSVGGAAGEFDYTYTVREVEINDSEQVVDLTEEWAGVVEIEDRQLPASAGPDPEEGVYTLMRAPDGHHYIDAEPTAGCGLTEDPDTGKFAVDFHQLAGRGLTVGSWDGSGSGSAECPQLDVDLTAGCGLDYDAATATVSVNFTDVVFDGLYWDNDLCALGVLVGCGLGYGPGETLALDLTDVVFDGLYWDSDNCTAGVLTACGTQYAPTNVPGATGDGIGVNPDDVAGDRTVTALVPAAGSGGGDCSVGVDLEVDSTTTETLVNAVSLDAVGGQLRLIVNRTTYTNHFNIAGLHINRTAGAATETTYAVNICDIDCGSGSGSGSGSGGGQGTVNDCCPEDPVPLELNWTITNHDDPGNECACIVVTSGTVQFDGVNRWGTVTFTCLQEECEENSSYYLCCDGNGTWYFTNINEGPCGGTAAASVSCEPFLVEFNVLPSQGGSYTITFSP